MERCSTLTVVKRKQNRGQEERRRLTGPIHGNIRELRERMNLSQSDLAEVLSSLLSEALRDRFPDGIDKSNVSHWETGFSRPDHDLLPALAKALKTSIDRLFREPKRAA